MSGLKFDLSALSSLPRGDTPSGRSASDGGRTLPWEALPLLVHRLVNLGAEPGRASNAAEFLVVADRAFGAAAAVAGVAATSYLVGFEHAFSAAIPSDDGFLWVALAAAWTALALHLVARLYGRYAARPASLSAEELRERGELHLPALLFNFQTFGTSCGGALAALVVTLVHLADAAAWGVLLYAAISRMATHDAHSATYSLAWAGLVFRTVLAAVARCASFRELRSTLARAGAPLSAAEAVRTALVCVYVCVALCLVLPLGAMVLAYVNV